MFEDIEKKCLDMLTELLEEVPEGIRFRCKDLFMGIEWKKLKLREKTYIAGVFQEYSDRLNIEIVGKDHSDGWWYSKKGE